MASRSSTRHVAPRHRAARPLVLALRGFSALQRSSKPIHARGVVSRATLERHGSQHPSGVPWLDEPGTDSVLVRRSRGAGLPPPLPDVHGLTIRVPVDAGHADILLGSTGVGRLSRFVPVPTARSDHGPLTTLMPYRGPGGPVLLGARPRAVGEYDLVWATARSSWVSFGRLVLEVGPSTDRLLSFDPLLNPVPGLGHYTWARRVREGVYRAAREQSGRSLD